MRMRYLATGAALWAAGYLVAYVVVVRGQGDSPAWWYVAVVAVGALLLTPAIAGRPGVPARVAAVALLAVAALLGLLSIGVLLLPAVAAAAGVLVAGRPLPPAPTGS